MTNKPATKQHPQAEAFRLKPIAFFVRALLTGGFFMGTLPSAQANPEVNTLPIMDPATWTTGHVTEQTVGHTMTVTQTDHADILNWQSFDVGSHAKVDFVQPSADSVVVNEITASGVPSQIFGQISSNGEVYLINPNGIVFGAGSVVDTNGMVASTLLPTAEAIAGITNPGGGQALSGIANPNTVANGGTVYAAFSADGSSASTSSSGSGYTGKAQSTAVSIDVQSGAKITSENGKPILMFAPTILNEGSVSASGGQVMMAASSDVVYLQEAPTAGSQSDVRGLLVAVGTGGNVTNAINAAISANQGNVTLMGFAVNQNGRVSATTSINENGSIRLLASEGVNMAANLVTSKMQLGSASTTRPDGETSSVTLGAQSRTNITPELVYSNGVQTRVVASQTILRSRVEITAENVLMQSATVNGAQTAAQIIAPAGVVDVTATQNPVSPMAANATNGSSITVQSGVDIDVSGMNSTRSMASNVISVKLQSNELADSPLQKTGILNGKTVQIDIRADNGNGTPLANISSELASLTYTLAERLVAGGTIALNSEGAVNVEKNAQLNFSGGVETFLAGYIDTTELVAANGQLVNIGSASPLMPYAGIYGQYTTTNAKWGVTETWTTDVQSMWLYEPSYQQGGNAGTLAITANDVQMNGDLHGQSVDGMYQRSLAEEAIGGTLIINDNLAASAAQDIVFMTQAAQNTGLGGIDLAAALVLRSDMLARSGIQKASFATNGGIDIAGGSTVQLSAASSLSLQGGSIDVIGNIQGAGASVSLTTTYDPSLTGLDGHINVDSGATMALQGLWVNDFTDPANAVSNGSLLAINGGAFNVSAQGNVDLQPGSSVDVSGGAWLHANRTLTDGAAGSISLAAADVQNSGSNLTISGAKLSAYGLASGGSISLESNAVAIGGSTQTVSGNLQPLELDAGFFSSGGFASYTVISDANGLTVAANTAIDLQQTNTQLINGYASAPGAANISAISSLTTLPANLIQPSSLTLEANHSVGAQSGSYLSVGANSSIVATPQSTITLSSDTSINFDGSITDQGGTVNLDIVTSPYLTSVYSPSRELWLGGDANIDVSGTVIYQPNTLGLTEGSVLNGGTVNLDAKYGFVAAMAGSQINVSGAQALLSQPVLTSRNTIGYSSRVVGSNGGAVNITAAEGVYLDGGMQAQAGNAAGTAGGSLSVSLLGGEGANAGDAQLIVVQDVGSSIIQAGGSYLNADVLTQANGFNSFGVDQPAALNGVGIVGANQVAAAGFSSLNLQTIATTTPSNQKAAGEILFQGNTFVNQGNVDLSLIDALTLDAPVIGWALSSGGAAANNLDVTSQTAGSVNLTAATVAIGSSTVTPQLVSYLPAAVGGMGQFNVTAGVLNAQGVQQAGMITLQGEASTSGFGVVNLAASRDISLQGVLDKSYNNNGVTDSFQGAFETYGQLNLSAERIFPTTLSQFTLATNTATGVINFNAPNTATPTPVLEADAALTVTAATINQNGNILAPFGHIDFQASKQINFGANSLTSVSGQNQIIPFGVTSAGQDWLYPLNDSLGGVDMNLIVGGAQSSVAVPEKQLTLNAPTVASSKGAVIDLSGGGDLMAYEFVPGAGGSKDVLAAGNAIYGGTSFAIIPSYTGYAPYDPMLTPAAGTTPAQGGLTVGEQITIAAGSALPAGTYTLLPAHYALLAGAYLVTPVASSSTVAQGASTTLVSGTPVVSGYYDTLGTSIKSQTPTNFVVQTGASALKYSQINLTYGDSFFARQATNDGVAVPLLAQDAGQLSATVTTALDLPTLRTGGVKGAEVDISANDLSVVNSLDNAGGVELLASDLNGENIGSLFLGGNRSVDAATGNTLLNVTANTLTIGSNVTLNKVSELLLAATNTLEIKTGAALSTTGSLSTAANTVLETSGDSAVLRLAAGGQVSLDRTASSGLTGNLLIDQGASLTAASGSILLDASGNNSGLQGSFNFGSAGGGNLSIGANALNIGDIGSQTGLIGLSLDNTQLAAMGSLASLYLNGRNYVDIYGNVATPVISNLVLNTPVLAGMAVSPGAVNTASVSAGRLTLANYAGGSCASGLSGCTGTGAGTLDFNAGNLTLDATSSATSSGSFTVSGYEQVNFAVSSAVTGKGAGQYDIAANTTINTPMISGDSAASTTINTAGYSLTIDPAAAGGSATAATATSAGVGAILSLNAANLLVDSSLIYRGGSVNLNSATGNLNLGGNALVDVSATQQSAGLNPAVQIAGGEITLSAGQDVLAAAGSQLLLSATASGVSAGTLNVNARQGYATLGGAIKAGGADKAHGGRLLMDVLTLDGGGFNALNTAAAAADFSGEFGLRLRSGDIDVDNTQTVTAQTINLAADSGAVNIYGVLDASGGNGGNISLSSDSGVLLAAGSELKAYATGSAGNGGTVVLSAVSQAAADNAGVTLPAGGITIQSGATVDVRSRGDYSLVDCATLGDCGSLGKVELQVDRQPVNADGNPGNVSIAGAIDIAPINSGAASLGYDASQTLPEVVAVKVYDLSQTGVSDVLNQITASDLTTFNADAASFMQTVTANSGYTVMPGIEAITTGGAAMTVNPGSAGWNLSTWRYAYGTESVTGQLILRSSGDLNIQQTISDGFTTLTATSGKHSVSISELQQNYSWSYDLAAGADLTAANHQALLSTASNLNLSPATLVRTGTGDININVSGNINMSNNSLIYSAGRQDPNNPWGYTQAQVIYDAANYSGYYAEYPVDGGSVSVAAGGDINVTPLSSSTVMGFYSDWLVRTGSSSQPTSWGINFAKYNDNLGALGGGNVTVSAGGNIENLTVAIPTTGKINPADYAANSTASSPLYSGNYPDPIVSGGGNLYLSAGGNIGGGAFYVEQGVAEISAGGSLTAGGYYSAVGSSYLDPILALGNAAMNVTAGINIGLETILNPLVTPSASSYGKRLDSLFFSYGANSSVTLTALSGDVSLTNNPQRLISGADIPATSNVEITTYPGTLTVNALQGSLNILNSFQLYPAATGNLELYAYDNIDTGSSTASNINVIMSAADPSNLPSVSSPLLVSYKSGFSAAINYMLNSPTLLTAYAQIPVHLNDANPVLISTTAGNIDTQNSLLFVLPKQTLVSAGKDLLNTSFMIQNDTAASSSLVSAGGDITFNTLRDSITAALNNTSSSQSIQVSGPGQLTVLSGGNINLGSSGGILSTGNTGANTYLPSGGANVTVLAGMSGSTLNSTAFATDFMTDSSASSNYDSSFSAAVQKYLLQAPGAPTPASLQSLVKQAEASAVSALSAQGLTVTNGFKQYFAQYLQDYWSHYSGNLAVDGVLSLISQAGSSALAAQTLPPQATIVVDQYAADYSQYLQTALGQYHGTLTIAGLEALMSQADSSAVNALTTQGFSSSDLVLASGYKTAFNQAMQDYLTPYGANLPAATAVAGALSAQEAVAARTSFDQLQQAYTSELTQLVQNYLPGQTVTAANALNYLSQLSSAQQSLVETQLLPYVQSVYASDMQQYAEKRASAVLTVDKDSQELNMLAMSETLFRGSTLVANSYNKTFSYNAEKGWTPNAGYSYDTIIKNVDINLLNAIQSYQTANHVANPGYINMGNGSTINIAAEVQAIQSSGNSALGKALLNSIYAARPDLKAAVRPVSGDLSLFFSTIQTLDGGSINLFTPGGGIDAGLSATTIGQKSANQLGIIASAAGGINAFVRDDFQVNLTRVMTLGGGDVVAGSTEGSIDAGKGVALNGAVQEQVSYDEYGNPVVTLLPAVTTSGIRSATPQGSGLKSGAIVLFAPRGVIDAGEAGIAGGNLFLDASSFKNVANISSSTGVSVGAPTAPPAGLSAALSGTSGLTASINKSFENETNVGQETANTLANNAMSLGILTVDLLGFGD
ncbi:MAG: filamentous hemagglutinin family protein [Methylococcales bacterium]|nr:filamentous hemagglutinin family protein [Methylococcales bacterium]